ncbi:MAG: glycosyltransferase [Candidatus Brocadiia bacterium]
MVGIEVSLVVPAFNEAGRVVETVGAALDYLDALGVRHEVIVVDDGSTDGTGAAVEGAFGSELGAERLRLLSLTPNHGKGYAVRRGMAEARGRYVVFTDADLATPLEEIEPCLGLLRDGADIVLGSRHMAGSRILRAQPPGRQRVPDRAADVVEGEDEVGAGQHLARPHGQQDEQHRQADYENGGDGPADHRQSVGRTPREGLGPAGAVVVRPCGHGGAPRQSAAAPPAACAVFAL